MPTLPSVINAMKDVASPDSPPGTTTQPMAQKKFSYFVNNDKRRSSYDEKEFAGATVARKLTFKKSHQFNQADDEDTKPISKSRKFGKMLLTAKQKSDIADAFNAFDVAGTGFMDIIDLRVALKALGFQARMEEMHKLFGEYDTGNTGRLCYSDFMNIIEQKLGENDSKDDLLKTFRLFDKLDVGRISFQNLRDVCDELGEGLNDEEIAEMIAEADLDDDGAVNEEEFLKILKKERLY